MPYVPPIAFQQIETASAPIDLPAGPPPADDDAPATAFTGAVYSGDGGIASLADLDRGADAWRDIEPNPRTGGSGSGGLGQVAKIEPPSHRQPQPPKTEQAIGMYLAVEVPVPIRVDGVPGIAAPFLAAGNRALWFAPDGID